LLKERILAELEPEKEPYPDHLKTKGMLLLERQLGTHIEYIIRPRVTMPSPQLAELLDISESLLSKWRARLGITDVRVVKRGRKANSNEA